MDDFMNVRIGGQFSYIHGSQTWAIIINISLCPPLSHLHVLKCQSDYYLTWFNIINHFERQKDKINEKLTVIRSGRLRWHGHVMSWKQKTGWKTKKDMVGECRSRYLIWINGEGMLWRGRPTVSDTGLSLKHFNLLYSIRICFKVNKLWLPKAICMLFFLLLDLFQVTTRLLSMTISTRNIVDLLWHPGFNNSLDAGNFLHGSHYTAELVTTYLQLNKKVQIWVLLSRTTSSLPNTWRTKSRRRTPCSVLFIAVSNT